MWQQAGTILEQSQSQHTRFIGLQVGVVVWATVGAVARESMLAGRREPPRVFHNMTI